MKIPFEMFRWDQYLETILWDALFECWEIKELCGNETATLKYDNNWFEILITFNILILLSIVSSARKRNSAKKTLKTAHRNHWKSGLIPSKGYLDPLPLDIKKVVCKKWIFFAKWFFRAWKMIIQKDFFDKKLFSHFFLTFKIHYIEAW